MASRKKTPAKKETAGVPAPKDVTALMLEDGNLGLENVSAEDMAIPFLTVLQSGSPQVIKGPDRIDGAEAGDFFNNVSGEVFKGEVGIELIPVSFVKSYVEWIPREQGGGFVTQHADKSILSECKRNEKGRDQLPSGNEVVPTAYHYCLLLKDGIPEPVVVSLSSTQLKKSRKWLSVIAAVKVPNNKGGTVTPPSFSQIYKATCVAESNDKGNWYGWQFSRVGPVADIELYKAAREFHRAVTSGAVRMGPPPEAPSADEVPTTDEF
jgi:hypothetical protein